MCCCLIFVHLDNHVLIDLFCEIMKDWSNMFWYQTYRSWLNFSPLHKISYSPLKTNLTSKWKLSCLRLWTFIEHYTPFRIMTLQNKLEFEFPFDFVFGRYHQDLIWCHSLSIESVQISPDFHKTITNWRDPYSLAQAKAELKKLAILTSYAALHNQWKILDHLQLILKLKGVKKVCISILG